MKLTHVRILTRNFERSLEFYEKKLGLPVKHKSENLGYVEFDTGNATLAILTCDTLAKAINIEMGKGIEGCYEKTTIILQVDDVDKTYNELKEKGIVFIEHPKTMEDWGIRMVHTRDPDGNLIEFNTPLKK